MRWTALTGGVRDRVPRGARPPRLEVTGDRLRHEFVERRLELTAPRRPAGLLVMPRRGDTRRLLDDDHVVVEVHDPDVVGPRGSRRRDVEDLHHVALLQAAGGIGAQVAVDEHVASPHELLHVRPARRREPIPEERGDRAAGLRRGDVMRGAGLLFHEGVP